MNAIASDEEFIATWNRFGSATLVANHYNITIRAVYHRRKRIEQRQGINLESIVDLRRDPVQITHNSETLKSVAEIEGTVLVFSDAHFQPNETSVAFYALLKLIKKLKPRMIVANGDILDGATISKYGAEDWTTKPTLQAELEAVQYHMDAIVKACKGIGTICHRTIGNHCIRFDKRLANAAPEYKGIRGTTLKDHIPEWSVSWALAVNGNTMIKHRMQHSGIHSGYQNTLKSGSHAITGHTHLLEVKPWGDYNGRRYGVSTGMLADPGSQAFSYVEMNPVPWCSGFAILHYDNEGRLLPPELVEVIEGVAYFRGSQV